MNNCPINQFLVFYALLAMVRYYVGLELVKQRGSRVDFGLSNLTLFPCCYFQNVYYIGLSNTQVKGNYSILESK